MRARGRGFWASVVVGGALIGFGVRGALGDAATRPPQSLVWLVGADLVHDLVLAPLVGVVGFLVARFVREPWRAPVRAGLVLGGIVAIVGWPAWRGYGRDRLPDNASALPLDYTKSILTMLAVVWGGVLAWALVRRRAASRRLSASPPGAGPGASG